METNQKIQQIMQALGMREDIVDLTVMGGRSYKPTIDGDDRKALITELVKLLVTPE